jgi:hypothetical protein
MPSPQRDVERRHRHRGDAAAAIGHGRGPQVAPDRFDRGSVLALDARDDALFQTGGDRFHAGAKQKQIAHAADATRRLDVADQDIARLTERVALEPGIVGRPGQAQRCHANVANGHVGVGHCSVSSGAFFGAFFCWPMISRRGK